MPGLADYELLNWFGLFTTGGPPEPIINRLNDISNKALHDPKSAQMLSIQGIIPRRTTPAEFGAFVPRNRRSSAR